MLDGSSPYMLRGNSTLLFCRNPSASTVGRGTRIHADARSFHRELLAKTILTSDAKEILYALSLFEVEREGSAPVIRGLLAHPSAEVSQKAISILSGSGG